MCVYLYLWGYIEMYTVHMYTYTSVCFGYGGGQFYMSEVYACAHIPIHVEVVKR